MVVQLLKTVVFYINAFVLQKDASVELPPLSVIEGMVLGYNLHFRVFFGEFVHACEGGKTI